MGFVIIGYTYYGTTLSVNQIDRIFTGLLLIDTSEKVLFITKITFAKVSCVLLFRYG